jgi:histone deacetylase 1/2
VINCWYRFDENFNPTVPSSAPKNDPQEPKDKDPNPQACTASVASSSTQELVIPQSWFPDSGVSHHLTANFENLAQGKSYLGSSKVHIGNGVGLNISSIGHASFKSKLAPNHNLYLNQLLLVPSITINLLSVSKFALDNNVYFEFHAAHCFVKSQVNNQVLLKGSLGADGLYCFPHLPLTKGPTCLASVTQSSTASLPNKDQQVHNSDIGSADTLAFNKVSCNVSKHSISSTFSSQTAKLWHQRLGHANSKVLHNVLHLCNIAFNNKNSDFCDSCCMGKSHKIHAPLTDTVYKNPFELIHTDLWGPAHHVSNCGYTYYIAFVDACTKFTWLYFLKTKSDALSAFNQFHNMVKTQFSTTIKAIQSDWGGEFRSLFACYSRYST